MRMRIIRDADLDCRGHEFAHPEYLPKQVMCKHCGSLQSQAVFCVLNCDMIKMIREAEGRNRLQQIRLLERMWRLTDD